MTLRLLVLLRGLLRVTSIEAPPAPRPEQRRVYSLVLNTVPHLQMNAPRTPSRLARIETTIHSDVFPLDENRILKKPDMF